MGFVMNQTRCVGEADVVYGGALAGAECIICQDLFHVATSIIFLSCAHFFHE
jgi:hypothetical protein